MRTDEVQPGVIFGDHSKGSRWRGIIIPISCNGIMKEGRAEIRDNEGCDSSFPIASPLFELDDLYLIKWPKTGMKIPTVTLDDCVIVHPEWIEIISSMDFIGRIMRAEWEMEHPGIPWPGKNS